MLELKGISAGNLTEKPDKYASDSVCVCVCGLSNVTAVLIRALKGSSVTGSLNKGSEVLQTGPG